MQVQVESESPVGEIATRDVVRLAVRLLLGLVALLLAVLWLGSRYRAELQGLGEWFVGRFGYLGMALGTFIADGFHCPVPPQFYMLMAISSGASELVAMLVIVCGSLLGGYTGYLVAGKLARIRLIARRLERSRKLADLAFGRWGYRSVLIASVLPIAYSVLCYLSGVYRLPPRLFAVLSLCRIPRLIVFYLLVRLGWFAS